MPTNFPTSVDSFTRPAGTDPFHGGSATDAKIIVDNLSDAIEAIETEHITNGPDDITNWSSVVAYVPRKFVKDTDGNVWVAKAASTNVEPGSDATKWVLFVPVGATGDTGATGPASPTTWGFRQEGPATVATGSVPFITPFTGDLLTAYAVSDVAPNSEPVVVDVVKNNVSVWADTDDRPSIPAGVLSSGFEAPDSAGFSVGDLFTVDIISVGPEAEIPAGAIELRDSLTISTEAGGGSNSENIPIPTGYVPGDLLICVVGSLTPHTVVPPLGWGLFVPETADPDNASLHINVLSKIAGATELGSQSMSFTNTGPNIITTMAFGNPLENDYYDTDDMYVGPTNVASSGDMTGLNTGLDDALLVVIAAARKQNVGDVETIVCDDATTQTAAITNLSTTRAASVNLSLFISAIPIATASSGNGIFSFSLSGAGNSRWLTRSFTLDPGGNPVGAGRNVTVYLNVRETA